MKWLSDNTVERLRLEVELPDLDDTKYRLIRKLGSGGMGTVYLARDTELGRRVAVKVMSVANSTGDLASRMMREARIVALLEHPSIVPIHDVGTLRDGRVFYAMKLVQGKRLDEYAGTRSLADRLRVFLKVCEAVAFAHARGIIHRDLKPENVMVGPFGEVLVIDWGVAKILDQAERDETVSLGPELELFEAANATTILSLADVQSGNTSGGTVIGTPAYMPPEQALGKTDILDQRSDVYSLGAILYSLLAGRAPSGDQRAAESLSPRQINGKLSRAIEAICLKAMSERREDRYSGADEMAADVVKFLDGLPVSAYRENVFERVGRWTANNRFILLLILAYLAMRLVVFLFVGR